jgi:hypothetical protein
MDPRSRTAMRDKDTTIANGIAKRLAQLPFLVLNGVKYEPAKLAQMFRDQVARQDAAQRAYTEFRDLAGKARKGNQVLASLRRSLRTFVILQNGEKPEVLVDFGFAATKKGYKSTDVKEKAAEKAKLTRAARNTLGKRQKAKIKGTVQVPAPPKPAKADDKGGKK